MAMRLCALVAALVLLSVVALCAGDSAAQRSHATQFGASVADAAAETDLTFSPKSLLSKLAVGGSARSSTGQVKVPVSAPVQTAAPTQAVQPVAAIAKTATKKVKTATKKV